MSRKVTLWFARMALGALVLVLTAAPGLAQGGKTSGPDTLRTFVEERNVTALEAAIADGVDVNEAAGDHTTALHWASYWDAVESLDILLAAGAEPNRANDLGVTPIWLAAENGNLEIVRRLLDAGADPNPALRAGETPVMIAARAGHAEVVDLLLARGADPDARATRGQTALMWAAAQFQPESVEVLLRYGADVNARSESWPQLWQTILSQHDAHDDQRVWIQEGGYTPLLFAARVGDLASAKLLVDAGADVNDRTAADKNALILAVQSDLDYRYLARPYRPGGAGTLSPHALPQSDGLALLEFLLERGADPDAQEAGFTALHEAILRHNIDATRVLLAHGADPNITLKTESPTRRGSTDFFYDGPFVGATPFWLAARFHQPEVMRMLIEKGADPLVNHLVDYWAEGYRYTGFPRSNQGDHTALMAAVGMPRGRGYAYLQPGDSELEESLALEAAKIAVEAGVDITALNGPGRSALDGARAARYSSVVEYLEDLSAQRGVPAPRASEQAASAEDEEDLN